MPAISYTGRIVNAEKSLREYGEFLTDDEERTQRYVVSEVSELEAEKALRRYLNDRDEKIISVRNREPTGSEAASLNLSSGQVKLLN